MSADCLQSAEPGPASGPQHQTWLLSGDAYCWLQGEHQEIWDIPAGRWGLKIWLSDAEEQGFHWKHTSVGGDLQWSSNPMAWMSNHNPS